MEAGRELDAEIAEKVMGWRWWRRLNPITGQKWLAESAAPPDGMVGEAIPCEADSDLMPEAFDGPEYSSSIAAAWTVVEKLRREWSLVQIGLDAEQCKIILHNPNSNRVSIGPDSIPLALAICKAALEAVAKKERGI